MTQNTTRLSPSMNDSQACLESQRSHGDAERDAERDAECSELGSEMQSSGPRGPALSPALPEVCPLTLMLFDVHYFVCGA